MQRINSECESTVKTTVIPINAGRNSQVAVKWAVDHLLKKNSNCILIHVRTKPITHSNDNIDDDVPKHGRPPTQEELHQFFLPFRGFCARKGIEAKELVLHDIDVPSALTDYAIENSVNNVVVGASSSPWSALIRKFKDGDVASTLAKTLPESSTLYVISKGKVQKIRPTGPPIPKDDQSKNIEATPPKSIRDIVTLLQKAQLIQPKKFLHHNPSSDDSNRKPLRDAGKVWELDIKDVILVTPPTSNNVKDDNSPRGPRLSAGSLSTETSSNRSSPATSYDSLGKHSRHFSDISSGNHEVISSDSFKCLFSPKPPIQAIIEAEIKKLKLELKKTSEQYGMACREAVLAKQKTTELEKFRQEKERNVEKARLAEEAALALAEVERQKAKVAMESAEVSQRLAEMETKKRKLAELKAKHEEEERRRTLQDVVYNSIPYRRYNIKEIEVATNGFDNALKIGEGGYGPVFKGVLDHTVVAIKVLRPDLAHGERQFQQEIIVLSTIRHPNMVLLLGACPEYGCLVYEHMENGSLEDRLFRKDDSPPIPWKNRFRIASEIATGLLFLHQAKPEPIVHRDMKPANILLDKNCVSKISDVGLARLVPPSVANKTTQYRLTGAAGTFCYIDPEYQQTGLLGVKSDIYSFGMVLLQIITAKPPMGLSHLVEEAIREGNFLEVLDQSVPDCPVEEALAFAKLAIKCCELRKRDRPDLSTVILPELNRISHIWNSDED
ncbi:U-box domain-containing protein 35-like [Vicia villosa]|uniref:U-box domain-containing protein 35-like n=1 Tax=Vicia villosa TaxID=3911 RepID=UPI00273C0F66|nr:U-box domain-containing protein 35-like [Vicia villosa]